MSSTRRSHARGVRRGFTLVEAVACMSVLAVLGVISSNLIFASVESLLDSSTRAQLNNELSIAMDRIVRELRNIELDSGASGVAPDIDTVTASSLAWTDSDGDAYSLTLSSGSVMLAVDGAAAGVLLSDVAAFAVSTYDEDDTALAASLSGASCDPIRRVFVTATLSRDGTSETLAGRVFIRSTMSGAE